MTPFLQDADVGGDGSRPNFLDTLAEVLEDADGLEVDFQPTPQGRRLLATLGVTVKEGPKE